MLHSDHATRSLPWHPRTIQRTAASNARAGRQVARTLERMPPFVGDAPALGAVYDGELPPGSTAPTRCPRELRGRAITLAGAPGVGKTVLQRRLVSADAARGRRGVHRRQATEPTLAAELIAAYTAGAGSCPGSSCGRPSRCRAGKATRWSWPTACWPSRTGPSPGMSGSPPGRSGLACGADIGPPRSAEELARLTAPGLEQLYAGTDRAELVHQLTAAKGFEGRRCATATSSTPSRPLRRHLELRRRRPRRPPAGAGRPRGRQRRVRLLLEDLGHYGVARKDRDDQGMTVYLEEFSAVRWRPAAIDLAERLRDAGVGVVFVVQSYEGLGDEHQAARLLGSSAALIVHRMPQPERLLAAAGPSGPRSRPGSSTSGDPTGTLAADDPAALVDPDAVRCAEVGEAWIIAAGRSLHLQVAETPYSRSRPSCPPLTGTASPSSRSGRRGSSTCPTRSRQRRRSWPGAAPPRPVLPPPSPELPRLRLQLATAVREGDELALRRVLKRAARVAPTWDAEAELAELTAAGAGAAATSRRPGGTG